MDQKTILSIPNSARATSGEQDEKNLSSKYLSLWIQAVGTIYFCLSLIGGIYLIITATDVNYFFRSIGIIGIISSLIVLLICLGVAKIIKQNIYIINKLKKI
jgi:hypothetical protein